MALGQRTPRPALALLALLGAWLAAAQVALLAPGDAPIGVLSSDAMLLAEFAAVALVAARAIAERGERWAWALLAAGGVALALGDLAWLTVYGDDGDVPVPSVADALYVASYPLFFGGIVALARHRLSGVGRTLWLDGLVAAAASAAITAQLVFPRVLPGAVGEPLEIATYVAYPVGDLVLLFLVVAAVALGGWRLTASWSLLALSMTVIAASDALYLVDEAAGTYALGVWYDHGWPIGMLLLAGAAWAPARVTVVDAAARAGVRAIVAPLAFAGLGLAILAIGSLSGLHPAATALASTAMLAVFARLGVTFREHAGLLTVTRHEALTDALTGLGNRRAMSRDLAAQPGAARRVVLCDLDGFKAYNDLFGHPAGDALLTRLGAAFADAARVAGGTAYRMGGDEFCAVLPAAAPLDGLVAALAEQGEGFAIGASQGVVDLPDETTDADEALLLADRRLYAHKHSRRAHAGRQSSDVLLSAVRESHPDLEGHHAGVAALAEATARALRVPEADVEVVRQAAELHDVGKIAIPDRILSKPGLLDADEWRFVHRHTIIGERIVAAAPALAAVAPLVRASHERWDGAGYPDGTAGTAIPLGARVVAVCDAFDAMTHDRPYRAAVPAADAVAELVRCAGTQFDPQVVAAFARVVGTVTAPQALAA